MEWWRYLPRPRSSRRIRIAVLAPFIAEYQALTGLDLSDRAFGDSVLLGLAALYAALPRAAEDSAERWVRCAGQPRESSRDWQVNRQANELLPEVSQAIRHRLRDLDRSPLDNS